ncbi:MAG: septum site-determining protein MinC [Peptococcaceae bacterium]|nr:septum site-determining protein MinC [Peptococcaceae bacterium]
MGRDMVSIKGTRNGLVIVLDPNREFEEIKNTLLRKMESARGFFKGARFSFFQGHQEIPAHQKNELENICRQFGLVPDTGGQAELKKDLPPAPRSQAAAARRSGIGEPALMVRRSLRSGQHVSYPGHVVVLGDIHPGAEVVSGGSILVMGNCRGTVHAGAAGDLSAKVIALRLAPTVLSIAGRRQAFEQQGPAPLECLVARLKGQEIIFEKYQAGR